MGTSGQDQAMVGKANLRFGATMAARRTLAAQFAKQRRDIDPQASGKDAEYLIP